MTQSEYEAHERLIRMAERYARDMLALTNSRSERWLANVLNTEFSDLTEDECEMVASDAIDAAEDA